jgi:hypothetical protein
MKKHTPSSRQKYFSHQEMTNIFFKWKNNPDDDDLVKHSQSYEQQFLRRVAVFSNTNVSCCEQLKQKITEFNELRTTEREKMSRVNFYDIDAMGQIYESFEATHKGFAGLCAVDDAPSARDQRLMWFTSHIRKSFCGKKELSVEQLASMPLFKKSIYGCDQPGMVPLSEGGQDYDLEIYLVMLLNYYKFDHDRKIYCPLKIPKFFNNEMVYFYTSAMNVFKTAEKTLGHEHKQKIHYSTWDKQMFESYEGQEPVVPEELTNLIFLQLEFSPLPDHIKFLRKYNLEVKADNSNVDSFFNIAVGPHVFLDEVEFKRVVIDDDSYTQHTYIIKNTANGLFKIGKSKTPKQRIRTLETSCGNKMEVCCIFNKDIELQLHREFSNCRTMGEWFALDEFQVKNLLARHEEFMAKQVL